MRTILLLPLMIRLTSGDDVHTQGVACQTFKSRGMPFFQNWQDICEAKTSFVSHVAEAFS